MKRRTCELLTLLVVLCALGVAQTTPYYIVNTVAGQGKLAYSGDGKLATSVYLFEPGGMVFDKSGNLYFTNGRVWSALGANGPIGFNGATGTISSPNCVMASSA